MSIDDERQRQKRSSESTQKLEARVRLLERHVEELRLALRDRRNWRDRFRPTLFMLEQYPPREFTVPKSYNSTVLPPKLPSIALVTPSFNSGIFIERTIRSVLMQEYPALSYVVQDGGSTDETHSILRRYEDRLSWVSEPDNGQAHAINRGFAKVKGDLMGWLNSDDMLLPGALAYVSRYFCEHPEVDVVYGHRICVDRFDKEIGRIILPQHDSEVIKWVDFIPQETLFWRRHVWDKLEGLDLSFDYAMDWDFILRAHEAGFRFRRLPRFLGCFRIHDEQKTSSQREIGDLESARLRRQYLGRSVTPHEINKAIGSYLRRHIMTVRAYKLRLVRY